MNISRLMNRLARILGPSFLVLAAGCSAAATNKAVTAVNNADRATARGAVTVAMQTWNVAESLCEAYAATANANPVVVMTCETNLPKAHDLIASAAEAINTQWTASAGCDLATAIELIKPIVPALGPVAIDATPVLEDALKLTSALGSCADAGK